MTDYTMDVPDLTVDDLQESDRIITWLTDRFGFAGLPPSRYLMSRGIACAIRAVANASEPRGLFLALLQRGLTSGWDFLGPELIARAEQRLADLQGAG